jgi:protein gp37
MADTTIEWTDATWNPVAGCTVISPGCSNCYAMRMAARLEAMGSEKYRGLTRRSGARAVWTGKIICDEKSLDVPRKWSTPRRIFVNSMSDLFHEGVSSAFVRQVWQVMAETPRHTYQILTKRPDRMAALVAGLDLLPNVWLGTSVEDGRVLCRINDLRMIPATVRFVSFEPLIGSVRGADLAGIQWAIVGGESGPQARAMDSAWVDEIVELCTRADVKFFFKQWGGKNKKATGRSYRGQTWDDFPSTSPSSEYELPLSELA